MDLPVLNYPAYDFSMRCIRNRKDIYDPLRKKYVALTPEEWVRQHTVRFLTGDRGYPAGLTHIEATLKIYSATRRCDILVYTPQMTPLLVAECKAPEVTIAAETFDQIATYNSVIGAPLLLVTNGIDHFCCRMAPGQAPAFLKDIPHYEVDA